MMVQCPKCGADVDSAKAKCEQCGYVLENVGGTLDLSQIDKIPESNAEFGAQNQNASEHPDAEGGQAKGASEAIPPDEARGTVPLPNPLLTSNAANEGGSSDPDSMSTLQSDGASKEPQSNGDVEATFGLDTGTQPIPGMGPAGPSQRRSTMAYSPSQQKAAEGKGESGTPGRLKRIWEGAGDSGQNPDRTIKGGELEASDSVFDRISPRILVADTIDAIAEKAGTRGSKPENKKNVRETIATACSDIEPEKADYELVRFLGQGGMGVVIEAKQRTIDRSVAIKMIQPGGSTSASAADTQAQMKKFFYEAQITGKLDHPNIVPIYELGISNNVLFYSMKKIVGTEWKDTIHANTKEENLEILLKVANAMAFAHERSVIHRDLKPENVMIGEFGEVLVTDWGCAVDLSLQESFSGAGSPPWMAPEMARHQQHLIGPRSDIYLMGAMLYEIVAGHPPHPGRDVWACLEAAAHNQILPVSKKDPLLDIASKAMETDPDNRHQTVAEFRDAILEYKQHAESVALTERSEESRLEAVEKQDYELFSKSQFGFQEALELWPSNQQALAGLAATRLSYGQCAFDRGDFDLCANTVDRNVPAESELYKSAVAAKREADGREARLKRTRMGLLGLGAASLIGAVVAAFIMFGLYTQAGAALAGETKAKEDAVTAQKAAEKALEGETKAKKEAERALEGETNAKKAAEKALEGETKAKKAAENALEGETKAKKAAEKALEGETKAKKEAVEALEIAVEAKEKEQEARAELEVALADAVLTDYQSRIGLAFSKSENDSKGARLDLSSLEKSIESKSKEENSFRVQLVDQDGPIFDEDQLPVTEQFVPEVKNWAWNRILLLSNGEALGDALGERVSAAAFANEKNRGVVATYSDSGQGALHVVALDNNKAESKKTIPVSGRIEALSISNDGSEAVYTLANPGGSQSVFQVALDVANFAPRPVAQKAESQDGTESQDEDVLGLRFQKMVMANDRVLAGVNGGLWVWDREPDWLEKQPRQLAGIRGRILSLQMMDDKHALMLADFKDKRYVYRFDVSQRDANGLLELDASQLKNEVLSCVAFSKGRLLLGTETGRLFTTPFDTRTNKVGPNFSEATGIAKSANELRRPAHRSAIRSIQPHPDGSLLTTAAEAVAVVWKPSDSLAGWSYDSFLVGTTTAVQSASFMVSSNLIFAVGEEGRPIVWDVQRQQERQRVTRKDELGEEVIYKSPVIQVVTSAGSNRVTAVHQDGTLDTYNSQTGATIDLAQGPGSGLASSSRSFMGHSPGTEFEDMSIDADADVLVTSAFVPSSLVESVDGNDEGNEATWEFCKWRLSTGEMLARWTRQSATAQEISIADEGRLVLYASEKKTIFGSTEQNQQENVIEQRLGSFFGVPNPINPNLLMLVKKSGAVRVFDTSNSSLVAELPNLQKQVLLAENDVPQVGIWSAAGDRFYMVWSTGRTTELGWQNSQLSVLRDLRSRELDALGIRWTSKLKPDADGRVRESQLKITSRHNLGMKIRTVGASNVLVVAARFPGTQETTTRVSRIRFPLNSQAVTAAQKTLSLKALRLVLSDGPDLSVATDAIKRLPVDPSEILAARSVGDFTYVATSNSTVYRVNNQGEFRAFGQPSEVVSASGDRAGDRIVTLSGNSSQGQQTAGIILRRADFKNGTWKWSALKALDSPASKIALSPDGTSIVATTESGLMVLDAQTGEMSRDLPGYVSGSWDPAADSDIALVATDGRVRLLASGQNLPREIGAIPVECSALSVHHFQENWAGENKATPSRWLAIFCQRGNKKELRYVSLSTEYRFECDPLVFDEDADRISCSPSDNVFVTGSQNGNVRVYFAYPTLKEPGKELFSLDGHTPSPITALGFSADGKTIISADDENRLYGWLSEDENGGFSKDIDLQLNRSFTGVPPLQTGGKYVRSVVN